MDKKKQIREYLQNGFNCAQAVTVVFAEELNLDRKTLLAAAGGFGGGMGRQAMTCGALTGAIIVLGFDGGQTENNDTIAKEICYQSVQDFFTRFKKIHGATDCRELLHCDISTPEGLEKHKNGEHREMCRSFMDTTVDILEKMLKE